MPRTNRKPRKNVTPRPLPLRSSAMLLSRREVTVSGCRRIIEYSSAQIKLSVSEGTVVIEGRGMTVHTYLGDELTVRGWLTGIRFKDSTDIAARSEGKEKKEYDA